jgi:hypothetical protein
MTLRPAYLRVQQGRLGLVNHQHQPGHWGQVRRQLQQVQLDQELLNKK